MVRTGESSQSTEKVGTRRREEKVQSPSAGRETSSVNSQTPAKVGPLRWQDRVSKRSRGTEAAQVASESTAKLGTGLQRDQSHQVQSPSSGQKGGGTFAGGGKKGRALEVSSSIVEGWRDNEDDEVSIDSDEREREPEQPGAAVQAPPSPDEARKECSSQFGSEGESCLVDAVRMQGKEVAEARVAERTDPAATDSKILTRAVALRNERPPPSRKEQKLNVIPEEFKHGDIPAIVKEFEPTPATVEGDIVVILDDNEPEELAKASVDRASAVRTLPFSRGSDTGCNKRLCARQFRRGFTESKRKPGLDTASMVEGRMRGNTRGDANEGKKLSELKSTKEKASEEGGASSIVSPVARQRRTAMKLPSEEEVVKDIENRPSREERAKKLELMAKIRKGSGVGGPANKEVDPALDLAAERKSSLRERAVPARPSDDRATKERRMHSESGSHGTSTSSVCRGTPTDLSSLVNYKRTKREVSPLKVVVASKRTPPKRGIDKEAKHPNQASAEKNHQLPSKDKQQELGHGFAAGHIRESVSEDQLGTKRQKIVDGGLKDRAVLKRSSGKSSNSRCQDEADLDDDQEASRPIAPVSVGFSELKEAAMDDSKHHVEDSGTGAENTVGGIRALEDTKEDEPLKLAPLHNSTSSNEPSESLPLVDSSRHQEERQGVKAAKIERQSLFKEICPLLISPQPARHYLQGAVHCPLATKTVTLEKPDDFEMGGDDKSDVAATKANDSHNSYCERCSLGGELICCDGIDCKVTYHLDCTEPKLSKVPSGNWYCPTCAQKNSYSGAHATPRVVESIWAVRDPGGPSDYPGPSVRISNGTVSLNRDFRFRDQNMRTSLAVCGSASGKGETGLEEYSDVVGASGDDTEEKSTSAEPVSRHQRVQRLDGRLPLQLHSDKRRDEDASREKCNEREYFVKWKGIAHAHNGWITEADLGKLSPKCLANYKRKVTEGQAGQWNPDWIEPQRLVDTRLCISSRRSDDGDLNLDNQQEWFVKWKGLGYEHCTWESLHASCPSYPKFQELEIMYDKWKHVAHRHSQPQEILKAKKLRQARFQILESKPPWFHIEQLLPYQLDKLNLLRQRWHNGQNTIIEDEDKQEKLPTIVLFILSLIEEYGVCNPILVVVPAFDLQRWEAEILEYASHVNTVVYVGTKEARGIIQQYELNRRKISQVQVVLTTYEVACSEVDHISRIEWEALIVDECQHAKATKFHRASLKISPTFLLFFVNDVSKYNVEELLHMLSVLSTKDPPSTPDVRKSLVGLDESAQLRYLQEQLRQHVVNNWKPDDSSGLELKETWIGTNLTPLQLRLYCKALIKSYPMLYNRRLRADQDGLSLQDLVKSLWTCCQHPYLYDPAVQEMDKQGTPSQVLIEAGIEASEKWQLLDAMLSILHAEGHRAVIISQALQQLYIFDDYLRQKYGPESYELIDTRNSTQRKNAAIQKFNAKDSSRFVLLLRTGTSGFRLKLKDKDVVILHGSDLNPANDLVYLRRILHKGDGDVKVIRLYQRCTIEEGSMVYFHQKKLAPDSKPLSLKILQHLLRWKVQSLLESSPGNTSTPEERKLMAGQVLERAKSILDGSGDDREIFPENSAEEVAAEEDADTVKEFWNVLLKEKYSEILDDWEVPTIGKGLRRRKKVLYSEDALASAPYSIAVGEGSTRQKRKRTHLLESPLSSVSPHHAEDPGVQSLSRRADVDGDEVIRHTEKASSARADRESAPNETVAKDEGQLGSVDSFSEPVVGDRSHDQQGPALHDSPVVTKSPGTATTGRVPSEMKVEGVLEHDPSRPVQRDDATPTTADVPSLAASEAENWRRVRIAQKQQLLKMEPEVSEICRVLHLSEDIATYCKQLLSFVMTGYQMPLEPPELVVLVEIALCVVSASKFGTEVGYELALSQVGEKMKLPLSTDEFFAAYARVEVMFKAYEKQEADLQKSVPPEAAHAAPSQGAVDLGGSPEKTKTPDSVKVIDQTSAAVENLGLQDTRQLLEEKASEPQEQSKKGDPQGTASQAKGVDSQDCADHETTRSNLPVESVDQQDKQQRLTAALATAQPSPRPSESALRAKLKADKDRLLNMWITKQKDEMKELFAAVARDRARLQSQHEKEKAQVMGLSAAVERISVMVRTLAEDYASKCKLLEEGADTKCRELASKQRAVRDKINALYVNMLEEAAAGKQVNLTFEARKMGLTNFSESSVLKGPDHGITQTAQAHQAGPEHRPHNAQVTAFPQRREPDGLVSTFGGGENPLEAPNQRHLQTHLQPDLQLQRQSPNSHTPQPESEAQSMTQQQQVQSLSQPQQTTQQQQQVQSRPQPQQQTTQHQQQVQSRPQPQQQTTQHQQQAQSHSQLQQISQSQSQSHHLPLSRSQPLSEPQFQARSVSHSHPHPQPHSQHQPLQAGTHSQLQLQPQGQLSVQHRPQGMDSPGSSIALPHSQATNVPQPSPHHEGVMQPRYSQHSLFSWSPGNTHSTISGSGDNTAASGLVPNVGPPAIVTPQPAIDQRSVQPLVTQLSRPIAHGTTTVQGRASLASQAPSNLHTATGPAPGSLRPSQSGLHVRLPPSVQAASSLQAVASTSLQSMSSHSREAPGNLQHRGGQMHRQSSLQQPPRISHQPSATRVHNQQYQPAGAGISIPGSGAPGSSTQSESPAVSHLAQNVAPGAPNSSQGQSEADALAAEQRRLVSQQEGIFRMYIQEARNERAQYDRGVAELYARHKDAVGQQYEAAQQRMQDVSNNLALVLKSRQLAGAFVMRGQLDQQRGRNAAPGHAAGGGVAGGRVAALGRGPQVPGNQSIIQGRQDIGRGNALGTNHTGGLPPPQVGPGTNHGGVLPLPRGNPRGPTAPVNSTVNQSRSRTWQNSSASNVVNTAGQSGNLTGLPTGEISASALSRVLNAGSMRGSRPSSMRPGLDSSSQAAPSISDAAGHFQHAYGRRPVSNTLPSHHALAFNQRGSWPSRQNAENIPMAPSSTPGVRQQLLDDDSSRLVSTSRAETAMLSAEGLGLGLTLPLADDVWANPDNEFVVGRHHSTLGRNALSVDDFGDLPMPPVPASPINVGPENWLPIAQGSEPSAFVSQSVASGLDSNAPPLSAAPLAEPRPAEPPLPVPIIYLSDDD